MFFLSDPFPFLFLLSNIITFHNELNYTKSMAFKLTTQILHCFKLVNLPYQTIYLNTKQLQCNKQKYIALKLNFISNHVVMHYLNKKGRTDYTSNAHTRGWHLLLLSTLAIDLITVWLNLGWQQQIIFCVIFIFFQMFRYLLNSTRWTNLTNADPRQLISWP
jgi:hypothetical protein